MTQKNFVDFVDQQNKCSIKFINHKPLCQGLRAGGCCKQNKSLSIWKFNLFFRENVWLQHVAEAFTTPEFDRTPVPPRAAISSKQFRAQVCYKVRINKILDLKYQSLNLIPSSVSWCRCEANLAWGVGGRCQTSKKWVIVAALELIFMEPAHLPPPLQKTPNKPKNGTKPGWISGSK